MPRIKLIIWDADDTLWQGSVFYTDKEAVTIKPGTNAALKELTKRGIKNVIVSKNYPQDVLKMLKKFDIEKYFEKSRIGWGLKSESVRELLDGFKLAPVQVLFIDDDPFQRAEVSRLFPGLNITELTDPIDVLNIPGVRAEKETKEDIRRVEILKSDRDREVAENSHRGDYKDFLRSCNLVLTIRKVKTKDWPRVTQLLNRTNELNATGNRYTQEKLVDLYRKNKDLVLVVDLTDKFGDYGLIAETIVERIKKKEWLIRDLTVSCRTMGRGIGQTMIIAVFKKAKEDGVKRILGYITESESNWRMKPLLEKRGFTKLKKVGKKTFYVFDFSNPIEPYPDWLKIKSKL